MNADKVCREYVVIRRAQDYEADAILIPTMLVSGLQMRWLLPMLATGAALGQPGQETGSKVCAGCHAEIYRKYSQTSMSQSSGRVGAAASRESFDRASFIDPASGARYRISADAAGYRMEFSRAASGVEGKRLSWCGCKLLEGCGNTVGFASS